MKVLVFGVSVGTVAVITVVTLLPVDLQKALGGLANTGSAAVGSALDSVPLVIENSTPSPFPISATVSELAETLETQTEDISVPLAPTEASEPSYIPRNVGTSEPSPKPTELSYTDVLDPPERTVSGRAGNIRISDTPTSPQPQPTGNPIYDPIPVPVNPGFGAGGGGGGSSSSSSSSP